MNERNLELAKQAGCHSAVLRVIYGTEDALCDSEIDELKHLQQFADLIRADEREACAKVCEDSVEYAGDTLAEAIRARGNT